MPISLSYHLRTKTSDLANFFKRSKTLGHTEMGETSSVNLDIPTGDTPTSVTPSYFGDPPGAGSGSDSDIRCVAASRIFLCLHIIPNRQPSVSSCASAPVPPLPITSNAFPLPPMPTFPPPLAPGEVVDIDNASAEELRQALKIRNDQYKALTQFVVKITELVAEVQKFRR